MIWPQGLVLVRLGLLSPRLPADAADELRALATEVRDFIQVQVGVTDFSRVWHTIRKKTDAKRHERREKRNQLVSWDSIETGQRLGHL